jgi:hypothetical protein
MLGSLCPSRAATALTGVPLARSSEALTWRRSCSRILGTPARRIATSNDRPNWTSASLTGTPQPGAFYLVAGPVIAAGTALPMPDVGGLPAISADDGRFALVGQTTALG